MIIADDFGLGRFHDQKILELISGGQVDGTSVMIDGDMSNNALLLLKRLREEGALVGLHLNLTHEFDGGLPTMPLGALMRAGFFARLPRSYGADFLRQTDRFLTLFGSLPDFYDGHQHCHCLPGLAADAAALPGAGKIWMRVPLPTTASGFWLNVRAGGFKVATVAALAVRARQIFRDAGFATNSDFSGFLRLDDPYAVAVWLPRILAAAGPDHLVMVHPGSAEDRAQCNGHHPESRRIETLILDEQGDETLIRSSIAP